MVTRGGRKQQRKKAAAAEKVAEETTAASTAAQAAEETAAASTAEQAAGTVVKDEADMARGVSVAEAATTELEVVAETATEGSRTRGTPEEMVEAAVVRAARASGSEAKSLAVRRAVGIVVVESMQVGDVEAALEEIAGAVQAMGWAAAEATIMEVVQTMVDEGGESASKTLGVDLDELVVAIVWAAHAVVVDVHRVLASQFGELQQERSAVGAVHQQQAGSGPEEVLSTASRVEQATESSSTHHALW